MTAVDVCSSRSSSSDLPDAGVICEECKPLCKQHSLPQAVLEQLSPRAHSTLPRTTSTKLRVAPPTSYPRRSLDLISQHAAALAPADSSNPCSTLSCSATVSTHSPPSAANGLTDARQQADVACTRISLSQSRSHSNGHTNEGGSPTMVHTPERQEQQRSLLQQQQQQQQQQHSPLQPQQLFVPTAQDSSSLEQQQPAQQQQQQGDVLHCNGSSSSSSPGQHENQHQKQQAAHHLPSTTTTTTTTTTSSSSPEPQLDELMAAAAAAQAAHQRQRQQQQQTAAGPSGGEEDEPLLADNPDRFTMFPIEYPDVWEYYKKAMASFWTVEEVDLSQDSRDWATLSSSEQRFIKYVLAFFAASDGIVSENLSSRFMNDIQVPEVRAFYGFQISIENIHSEMYSTLLDTFVRDMPERLQLVRAIHNVPVIQRKAAWALKWIGSSSSFAQRLLGFACVEGIHFSGSFCAIFWLKKRGLMPGLTFSNELISRDEGLHTDFACLLYSHLRHRLPQSAAWSLVGEAVELERQFCCEALSVELVGMNAGLMNQYIQFVADRLLVALGYEKLYNAVNPFDWMEMISLQGKTNFFERRVGDYAKAGVMAGLGTGANKPTWQNFVFTTEEDF